MSAEVTHEWLHSRYKFTEASVSTTAPYTVEASIFLVFLISQLRAGASEQLSNFCFVQFSNKYQLQKETMRNL